MARCSIPISTSVNGASGSTIEPQPSQSASAVLLMQPVDFVQRVISIKKLRTCSTSTAFGARQAGHGVRMGSEIC